MLNYMIEILTLPIGDMPAWQFFTVCVIGVILICWKTRGR
jgi:hypothetical protein